jgi:phosphonate transport system substrate-binding protein
MNIALEKFSRLSVNFLLALVTLLSGCKRFDKDQVSICGPTGQLRVGYVGAHEGRQLESQTVLANQEIEKIRELLTVASQCDVVLEPVVSPEQAYVRLSAGQWDAAFLPPGLTALSLENRGGSHYSLLRSLGRRQDSWSVLLVQSGSSYQSIKQLGKARLGLLPRGALSGFYLPLYNLHGLRFASVHYALSYEELLEQLRTNKLDVIAWDRALPDPGGDVRPIFEDENRIPLGAFVLSQQLVARNYQPFLKSLDENASLLPPRLGYVSGQLPETKDLYRLRSIVDNVESWDLPQEGLPYDVYGVKKPLNKVE